MEQLRDMIMECLAEFFGNDTEECSCEGDGGRCPEVVDSDAATCAVLKVLRERIDLHDVIFQDYKKAYQEMEKRIAELEKKQSVAVDPNTCLTINCTGSFDADKFRDSLISDYQKMFARFR